MEKGVFQGKESDGDGGFKQRVVLDGNNPKVKKLLETDVSKGQATPLDAWLKNSNVYFAFLQGSGLTKIGRGVFQNLYLEEANIPSGVTEIGEKAFERNELKTLVLPDSLKKIGAFAFSGNELTKLVIPKNVEEIGQGAFRHNLLEEVVLTQKLLNKTNANTFLKVGNVEPQFFDHSGKEISRQP